MSENQQLNPITAAQLLSRPAVKIPTIQLGLSRDAAFFLAEPLANWHFVDQLQAETQGAVVRELDSLIERATRLRCYVDARNAYRKDHHEAVKHSNRIVALVRKALGFAYPKAEVLF